MAIKPQRKTTTIQVSPSLNLVLTKYATEQGCGKAEAADRIFSILYPKGTHSEIETSLEPPAPVEDETSTEDETTSGDLEDEEKGGGDISDELTKTVKDLRTVHTIRALTSGLNEKNESSDKITAKEAFELKKIEAMFGPKGGPAAGTDALDASFQRYLAPLQDQIKLLEVKIGDQRVADAEKRASDAEKKLEERDQREERQTEIQTFLVPIQDKMAELGAAVGALGATLKPGSDDKPTSDELKAINTIAGEIRGLVQKLGQTGGDNKGPQNVTDLFDQLTSLLDKVQAVQGKLKGGGGDGDFDWRAATISTIGEVATEALKTYRDTNAPTLGTDEEAEKVDGEKKTEEISNQVVLRRVYNYAVKKIADGELQLDPYAAGKVLNLTPNQVWWSIDQLRKKKLLTSGQPAGKKAGDERTEHGDQGLTELPPGVEA